MGAAIGGRHGVAVGGEEAVGIRCPGHRPLAGAVRAVASGLAGEDVGMHQGVGVDRGAEIILQPTREMEGVLGGNVVDTAQQFGIAVPADFDAAEKVGLRPCHLEQALRLERRLGAENVGVGLEANAGAAAVVHLAEVFQLALGMAALERHLVELLLARDFHLEARGEGVDHRDADTVQTARGLVDLGVELATRVQRAHDDFERRLFRKLRMRVDRNAAPIVADGQKAVRSQADLNEGGVAGQSLVHRVVDDFSKQVMQCFFVRAADVHPRSAPDRLQPLQHLDIGRRIAGLGAGRPRGRLGCSSAPLGAPCKQVVRFVVLLCFQWLGHISSCVKGPGTGESLTPNMPRKRFGM